MAKNIKRTVLSEKSPRNRHIAWAEPKGENIQLNIFNNGKWRPINGSGSSSSSSDSSSESGSGCNCNNVIISYNTYNGTWRLVQGDFENAMEAIIHGIPINISIWDMDDTIKPHSIYEYFPASPDHSLPFSYKNLVIEEECIIIVTDTMRTLHDIVVWIANGIYYYTPPSEGGDEPSVPK